MILLWILKNHLSLTQRSFEMPIDNQNNERLQVFTYFIYRPHNTFYIQMA